MPLSGDSADVPAVARGEERQQADSRVFSGVGGTGHIRVRDAGRRKLGIGNRPPHPGRLQGVLGQVECLDAEQVPAADLSTRK